MDYLKRIEEQTRPELWALIIRLGELAEERGAHLFLAGGRVRDLLLGRESADFDLVVEGDALELVKALAGDQGGEAVVHSRFGTATYRRGNLALDIATSRTEEYSRPGVLPDVRPGPIKEDLKRRDFTVNAMAISLGPPDAGVLLDRFGGQEDLEKGLVRVLHEGSFVDDPTRTMRAIRYEQRLGFQIEPDTLNLLYRDLHLLPSVGVDRLRREIELFLLEPEPELQFSRAEGLGIIDAIERGLVIEPRMRGLFKAARDNCAEVDPTIYLALLLHGVQKERAADFLERYRFPKEWIQTVAGALALRDAEAEVGVEGLRPSGVYGSFKGYGRASIQAFGIAAKNETVRSRAAEYLDRLAHVRLDLSGKDLLSLGVPRGPQVGEYLKRLLDARLDGLVTSRDEEATLVKNWLEEAGT